MRWYYSTEAAMVTRRGTANEELVPPIFTIRGHQVVLDADLARLYGVPTFRFNEAFKRNRHRFPGDFAFQLTAEEFDDLRAQSATSKGQALDSSGPISSQFAMRSNRQRGATYRPWAFTEHGVLMAANVSRSERAVQMSIFVVRAFVRLREQVAANTAILKRLAEIDRILLEHNAALRDLYRKLLPLLQPPAAPRKRSIGFVGSD
ncbi:MAG TPA: ORF6N domain-containing protein [Burkholderiales bacterium]|nr:ORF6N domain-containing protein [Burkholderiales bacterium]